MSTPLTVLAGSSGPSTRGPEATGTAVRGSGTIALSAGASETTGT